MNLAGTISRFRYRLKVLSIQRAGKNYDTTGACLLEWISVREYAQRFKLSAVFYPLYMCFGTAREEKMRR
jgi:hypothetical protein